MSIATKPEEPIYEIVYRCSDKYKDGHSKYHVKCRICGYETDKNMYDIKHTFKCRHKNQYGVQVHNWCNQRLRNIYNGILDRCLNKQCKSYKTYGGNGITICDEWLYSPASFEKWAIDNGYDDNLSIDRINNSKGYEPDNCRWITVGENSRYKSTTNYIDVDGVTKSGREWSEYLLLGPNYINTLLRTRGENKTKQFIRHRMFNPAMQRFGSGSWLEAYDIES